MEVQTSSKISTPSSKLSSKRFLFDKRYGYVYDEWREPSEVALAYGRGMVLITRFRCIVSSQQRSIGLLKSGNSYQLDKVLLPCFLTTITGFDLQKPDRFCIVPLGKALLTMVSESVNLAASRTIQVVERPDQLSPQSLQAKLNNNIMFPIKNIFRPKHISISPLHVTSASSHSHANSHE
uniref:Uncharacterized protein n=1 Tax=Lactuca sativa TaxID=4236 RepID=A0A9R1XKV2_LACSA|nr:hypothetical protein LSAT_V11C300115650 [Lactuca sativa]